MNRSVVRTRSAAAVLVTYPRSMPMGYAVSANPTAATLEKLFVGQRSGVRPFAGFVFSQNQLKVRCSSVSRNAVCRGVICAGVVVVARGAVAVEQPSARTRSGHSRAEGRKRLFTGLSMAAAGAGEAAAGRRKRAPCGETARSSLLHRADISARQSRRSRSFRSYQRSCRPSDSNRDCHGSGR